ncbi:MAG: HD-GYP domain-containing protein (c-di-GMP phosphodiesterase class II) [Psychromonas sp.]|jgi:HD-GYP domain-containing protein (c-di-GMP phosphodiesterase class II)|uniref:HD-GYP domain-containing protein n=1 Tax=Psychromonas sp. TaxID=1884585 RepID=UPI0039E516C3
MIVELSIVDLRVGMYLLEISAPKGKFHIIKPGWVETEKIIEGFINKGIERMLIDTSKQRISLDTVSWRTDPDRKFFQEEIIRAKSVFDESKNIQKKVFHDAQNGAPLDLQPVRKITDEAIDLIFNNPDALACVINIRRKDEYLLEHSVAVSVLITIFAFYMQIEKETVRELAIGAFLHDVGKIKTPDQILNKPGKLTDDEFEIMKEHASHSINIVKMSPGISALSLEVVRLHHEKLNGEGYPSGVKAEKISRYGRMISICDIFDALTSNRCYKQGYSHVKAFTILRALAENKHLDALLVDTFIKCMGVYPVGALVQLDSNRLAIVESQNRQDPIRPKVKPFYCLQPKYFTAAKDIDLSISKDEQIVKCVRADDFDLDMELIIEFLAHEG